MQLFIHNPENPYKPTRVIGLGGSNHGSIWSWKEVAHIHMSDIAASSILDDAEVFGAAFSRLANTNGTMLIESGPMYPMYYECDFYNSSSTWYKPEMFQYGEHGKDI